MEEYPYPHPMGVTKYTSRGNNLGEISLKFSPNLYLQRYYAVLSCLERIAGEEDIRVITEFGPNNCNFLYQALEPVLWLEKINLVDIDHHALSNGVYTLRSGNCNRTVHGRVKPLTAHLYRGNIAHADHRVSDADVVIGIELIEHMVPCDLEKFPSNVFGFMQPKYVIFTTPNSDFNVLFNFKKNQFRHHDHKFEFSRLEFREWAQEIVESYPSYDFTIYGIGAPPEDTKLDVGFASQMVIFIRKYDPVPPSVEPVEPYELIDMVPLNCGDSRTLDEKRLAQIGKAGSRIISDLAFDRAHSICMPQERCPHEYDRHWMEVVPVRMVLKHLQYENIITDVDTVMKAFEEWNVFRYEIEMTIAFGPVFVESCDCDSQPHAVPFEYDANVAPSPSFYALPSVDSDARIKCQLGDDATDERLDRTICLYTEQFLDSVVAGNSALIGRRAACEVEHSMRFATPEMVAAHLKCKDIETNAADVQRSWQEMGSAAKYPIEETSFGCVFLLEEHCGETPCVLEENGEYAAHSSWDVDDSSFDIEFPAVQEF